MSTIPRSNFAHLHEYDGQLMRLGVLAEKYFTNDPVACLLNLQEFSTLLAQLLAARVGLLAAIDESFYDLLRRLEEQGYLPREIAQLFIDIRRFGNVVNHAPNNNHGAALSALKIIWQLGLWFHRTFGDPSFESGPFIPPATPQSASEELSAELGSGSSVGDMIESADGYCHSKMSALREPESGAQRAGRRRAAA